MINNKSILIFVCCLTVGINAGIDPTQCDIKNYRNYKHNILNRLKMSLFCLLFKN
jgi:hypothetical protein